MKILNTKQVQQWDQYTIKQEPILSIDLMERASMLCVEWLLEYLPGQQQYHIFCGNGNNGGDGLAIARLLHQQHRSVAVTILDSGSKGSADFQTNLERLKQFPSITVSHLQSSDDLPAIEEGTIIIDALYGSGLNRKLEGLSAAAVDFINNTQYSVISIDLPSGLFTDQSSIGNSIVKATHTLTFQCNKPAFMMAENETYIGESHVLDIGLHPSYQPTDDYAELIDEETVQSIYRPRRSFSHKGSFGHALLVAGSYGKIGAAVLAAKACLRSGVGLLTVHIPQVGYTIMQSTVPEAMVSTDFNSSFITKIETDFSLYKSIGIGPGIGQSTETKQALHHLLTNAKLPMVIDADALNILSTEPSWYSLIPEGSILTPHPKEFSRLFGDVANDFDRIAMASQKAKELNCVIVLKGHHSFIATPDGKNYFNNTGNAGMATGGTGDVLTALLTGLICQGYTSVEAAILGVYLHGLAGDIAVADSSEEALIASDLVQHFGKAFRKIR